MTRLFALLRQRRAVRVQLRAQARLARMVERNKQSPACQDYRRHRDAALKGARKARA